MVKGRLFNLNDRVILKTGQKGIIFRIPDCTIDPEERSSIYDDDPIYGVLYIDDKGFHFGPYDVNESGMKLYSEDEVKESENRPRVYRAVNLRKKKENLEKNECTS